ncbi:MAG: FAD-dependent oxidoreductase [Ornithinimicrobium sp.]
MKSSAQVVVIGGGVVGASVLYHLTKVGLSDVMLLERSELTSGSTWHAAGGMHTLNGDPNVAALQKYTVALYAEIQRSSGIDCGLHQTGGLILADTAERLDWLTMAHARNKYLGLETEIISVAQAREHLPIMDGQYFVGAMFDPFEGNVDPTGVTRAFARCAQLAGAQIEQHTRVQAINRRSDGLWELDCGEQGSVVCEHFVNAGGLWAREVGRMCGLELPVLAMEHHYLITEPVPTLKDAPIFHAMDFGGEVYLRREGEGLLLGTYEPNGVPWSPHTTPWNFGHELLVPDLDRISENLSVAIDHFPIFGEVGIKTVINGPFTFAPDGNPLIGPVRGQPGHWVAAGVMAGLSQGGGVGLALANWIAHGDPGFDVWGMDVARFGPWATPAYTDVKVRENYGRRFRIAYPNEQLPAGRNVMTSPIYPRLDAAGAVWGVGYGLEHALWFQPESDRIPGQRRVESATLRRSNAFTAVAAECEGVRTGVGLIETTNFAKYEFAGPGARSFLDRLLTNRIPAVGRMALTPMLNDGGKLIGDFTVAALPPLGASDGPERLMVFGSGVAQGYHERWFDQELPSDGSVHYRSLGVNLCGLAIAGPASRDLLASVTTEDVGADAFALLDVRAMNIGSIPVLVGRISFTGDLGYEIWVEPAYQVQLFDLLTEAGALHGLTLFGGHALNSLRLEKSYGAWATEYRPIYSPDEAGLRPFVKPDKGDFIGREAMLAARRVGVTRALTAFVVDVASNVDVADVADVVGDEPIFARGIVVGSVTSGGYAHHAGASVALGYLDVAASEEAAASSPADAAVDTEPGFEIEILGSMRPARRLRECLFDPTREHLRS